MGTAMFFSSCENKIETDQRALERRTATVLAARNFEMLESDSSYAFPVEHTADVTVYEQEEGEEPYTEFPKGVKIEQFGPNMQIVSRITSDYGQYFTRTNKWIAKNNVIVVNQKGDTLKTEELNWEGQTGRIYSDKFVKIISADKIINGLGFESDKNMANWQIKKVTGTLYSN